MSANLTKPRPDIVYLRRRLKVGEQPAVVEASRSNSLSLGHSPEEPEFAVRTLPYAESGTVLTPQFPAVKLDRRASAIGSLLIGNSDHVGWQMLSGETGYLYSPMSQAKNAHLIHPDDNSIKHALPELVPPGRMNRPALEYHKGILVFGLRQLHSMKRFIVAPEHGKSIQLSTMSGNATVLLPYTPDGVLYVSVIGGEVELRAETYRNNLHDTFKIGTYNTQTRSVQDFFKGRI